MRILKFVLFISLIPGLSFAQRGGGGHGGGGGGSRGGGGGGGFRGGSVGGGGFSGGAAYRGGGYGGYRGGGYGGYGGYRGGYGYGRYGYGYGFGLGFGLGWRYYGYGYGYPYGYGYGYGGYDPGYYDYGYDSGYSGYPSGYPSGYDYGYNTPAAGYGYNGGAQYNAGAPPVVVNQNIATGTPGGSQSSYYRKPDYYLIAFNDHTIQAAVSYSVDGNTLRYTTREGVQKTAPLSSVDARFSDQINRDRHVNFQLPTQQAR